NYLGQFGATGEPFGINGPDSTSILSYDAARVLLAASARGFGKTSAAAYPDPTSVRDQLLQFDAGHPYLGVGGAIAFTVTGSEPVKAFAVIRFQALANNQAGSPVATSSVAYVIGGKQVYCGASNCSAMNQ
ncbi:MAG: hypothetical protein ACRDHE_16480, partial [Ktedonobacterales bacterium]